MPEPRLSVPSLYLASASPRRRDLLAQIGLACHCLPVDLDEAPLPGEAPAAYVRRLALDRRRGLLRWRILKHVGEPADPPRISLAGRPPGLKQSRHGINMPP